MNKNAKLKLRHFFFKRFIPIGIAAAILYIIGLFGLKILMEDGLFGTSLMYEFPDVCAKMEECKFEAAPEQIISYFSGIECDFMLDGETGLEKAMVAVNSETGEIIASSDFTVYAVYPSDEEHNVRLFTCKDKDVIDFYMQYANDWNISIQTDEIYVNGTSFLPGKVTVEKLDDATLGLELGVIGTADFTPSADSGYEYLGTPKMLIGTGSLHDSEVMAKLINSIKGENGMSLTFTSDAKENFYLSDYSSDKIYSSKSEVEIDGTAYDVYIYAEYHFWEFFAVANVVTYIIMLAVIFAVCMVWSKISYAKYSAKFDLDEARRNMVNALAHDLKSPLTAVSGYAENLASGNHPEKNEHYAKAIMENTAYMNTIITSALDLSKTESITAVKKEHIDAAALVNELYEKYRLQADSKGISFKTEGICTVEADRALITQTLENLITNAVKFTPDNGKISVKSSQDSISITNTCSDAARLADIDLTAPFVKGSESRTDRTGTGLGLSIAKAACEKQSFTLKLKAENSSFTAEIKF